MSIKTCALSKLTFKKDRDVFSTAYQKAYDDGHTEKESLIKAQRAVIGNIRSDHSDYSIIAKSQGMSIPELPEAIPLLDKPKDKKQVVPETEKRVQEVESLVFDDIVKQNESEAKQTRQETLDKDEIQKTTAKVYSEDEALAIRAEYKKRSTTYTPLLKKYLSTTIHDFVTNKVNELLSVDYSDNTEAQEAVNQYLDKLTKKQDPVPLAESEAMKKRILVGVNKIYAQYGYPTTTNQLIENKFDKVKGSSLWTLDRMLVQAKKIGSSILNRVPNFFSLLGNPAMMKTLRDEYKLTDEEFAKLSQADTLGENFNIPTFVTRFSEALNKQMLSTKKYSTDNKASLNRLENDLSTLFREKQGGALPENVVSTIALTALNWLGTKAVDGNMNDDAAINAILGRQTDAEITPEQRAQLQHIGLLRSSVEADLGKDIRRQLNVKADAAIDGRVEPKIELALGKLAISTLAYMSQTKQDDFIQFNSIKATALFDENTESNESRVVFVKLMAQENENNYTTHTPHNEAIIATFKDPVVKSLMNKLFSIKAHNQLPSAEPVTYVNPKMKNTINDVSPHVMKAVKALQSTPMRPKNSTALTIKDRISRKIGLAIFGLNDDPTSYHKDQHDAVTAKNDQLIREYDYAMQYLTERGMSEYYPSFTVWKNSRMGENGVISMQNSKIHRHMFAGSSWEVEIATKEGTEADGLLLIDFKLAVAESLGYGVDSKSIDEGIKAFEDMIKDSESKYHDALEILRKDSKKPFTTKEEQIILDAVKNGGENGWSFDGLVAAAAYLNGLETGSFKTDIGREVDGKTNGYATSTLQLASQDIRKAKESLNRAGYYFEEAGPQNFAEFISKGGTLDTYQVVASNTDHALTEAEALLLSTREDGKFKNWKLLQFFVKPGTWVEPNNNVITQIKDTVRSLKRLLPPLVTEDGTEVTSFGRGVAKDPVMIGNYGAGLPRIARETAEKMYQRLLDDMHAVNLKVDKDGNPDPKGKINKTKITEFVNNINAVFSGREVISDNDLQLVLNGEANLRDLSFSQEEANQYKEMVAGYLGKAISIAMKKELANNTPAREAIVDSVKFMSAVFKIEYDKRLAAFINEKGGNYPDRNQMIEILEGIREEGLLPGYAHASSTDGVYAEFLDATDTTVRTLQDGGTVQQAFNNDLEVTLLNDDGSVQGSDVIGSSTNSIKMREYGLTEGVGSAVMGALSIDANTQASTALMPGMSMVNVHDAIITGLGDIFRGALNNNTAYHGHNKDWSFTKSVNDHLKKFHEKINSFNTTEIAELDEHFEKLGMFSEDVSTVEALNEYVADTMQEATDMTEVMREVLFADVSSVGQYVNNTSEYHPNEIKIINQKEANAAIDSLVEEVAFDQKISDFVSGRKINKNGLLHQNTKDPFYINNREMVDAYTQNISKFNSELDYDAANMTTTYADKLDSTTAPLLFEDLDNIGNKQETPTHKKYLRTVVDDLIVPALDIAETIQTVLGTSEVDRNIGSYDPSNRTVYIGTTESVSKNNTDMSAQEVAVHEWLHAVLSNAINHTTFAKRELTRLFNLAKAQTTWDDFLTKDVNGNPVFHTDQAAEEQAAMDRYDYIFNNPNGNQLHEFASIGLSNEQFRNKLATIENKKQKSTQQGSLYEELYKTFLSVLDWLLGAVRKSKGKTIDQALLALAKDMSTVSSSNMNKVGNFTQLYNKTNSATINAISDYIISPMDKYVNGRIGMPAGKMRKSLDAILGIPFYLQSGEFRKTMDLIAKNMNQTKESFLYKLAYGEIMKARGENAEWMKLMNDAHSMIDKPRQDLANTMSNQIRSNFRDDAVPTDKDFMALNNVVLKADLRSIMGKYTFKKIIKLLKDPSYIEKEITRVRKELSKFNQYEYYNIQATNLGLYMAQGKTGIKMQALNAHNIANMTLVPLTTLKETVDGDVALAESLIDELSTLSALNHTLEASKQTTAKYFESEYADNNVENGISFLMGSHESIINEAKEKLFNDDPSLMVKGYTHENYDANRSFVIGTILEEKELKEKGYVRLEEPLSKDKFDQNNTKTYMYLNKDALVNSTVSGIYSTTSKQSKGRDLTSIRLNLASDEDTREAYKEANKDGEKMYLEHLKEVKKQMAGTAISDTNQNHAIPIASPHGGITAFRYMMTEANKVQLLNKKDMAHKVLGRMQGNIIDKVGTKDIGEKVLLEAKKEFDRDYLKDPGDFTYVGQNAEGKYSEMWQLLPEDTRNDMKRIWGSVGTGKDRGKGIYVRTELLDIIFGYRKLSIADNPQLRQFSKIVRIVENVVQEVVRMAKSKIVILEPAVLIANIVSNTFLLMVKGVPLIDIGKNSIKAFTELQSYKKDFDKRLQIQNKIKAYPNMKAATRKSYESNIALLSKNISNNPVRELIEAGVFQSIVEDIDPDQLSYSKSTLETNRYTGPVFEKIQDKFSGFVKDTYDIVTINQNTKGYKALLNATQYSDFIARFTLYEHQTKKENMGKQESLEDIVQSFINYDIPQHRKLQYVNDIGAFMYTKFFFRIQRIIFQIYKEKPIAAIGLFVGQKVFGDVPDIGDTFLPTADMVGRVTIDPTNHLEDAFDMSLFNYLPFFSWFD